VAFFSVVHAKEGYIVLAKMPEHTLASFVAIRLWFNVSPDARFRTYSKV
jgi:hypothetical protein